MEFCSDYNDPFENDEKSHCSFGLPFPDDKQYRVSFPTPVVEKVYSRTPLFSVYLLGVEGMELSGLKSELENVWFIFVEKAGRVWAVAAHHAASALPIY